MQLRQNRRPPGRYREDGILELPPKSTAVQPLTPFDPTLRPAAFPTLETHQFYTDNIQETDPGITATQAFEPIMSSDLNNPGEFQPRIGEEVGGQPPLSVKELRVDWNDLSDGAKIIIVRELGKDMPFRDVARFIQLQVGDIKEFMNLLLREVGLVDGEATRLQIATNCMIATTMDGYPDRAKEEFDAFMEKDIVNEKSTLSSTSENDVAKSKIFLLKFLCREEFPYYDPRTAPEHIRDEINALPSIHTVVEICSYLESYIGTRVAHDGLTYERELIANYFEVVVKFEDHDDSPVNNSVDNPDNDPVNDHEDGPVNGWVNDSANLVVNPVVIPDHSDAATAPKSPRKRVVEELSTDDGDEKVDDDEDDDEDDDDDDDEPDYAPPSKKMKTTAMPYVPKNKALDLTEKRGSTRKAREGARGGFTQPPSKLRQVVNYESESESPPPTSSIEVMNEGPAPTVAGGVASFENGRYSSHPYYNQAQNTAYVSPYAPLAPTPALGALSPIPEVEEPSPTPARTSVQDGDGGNGMDSGDSKKRAREEDDSSEDAAAAS